MKLIPLTQEKYAMVDDADYGWLLNFTWHAKKGRHTWYASTGFRRPGKSPLNISMHRLLCPFVKGHIDHRNGNGLFNSRSNLRPATLTQNGGNRAKNSGVTTSIYKGVSWDKRKRRWAVHVGANGYLGRFVSEIDAAKAYDKAALEKWGEFARLNFTA